MMRGEPRCRLEALGNAARRRCDPPAPRSRPRRLFNRSPLPRLCRAGCTPPRIMNRGATTLSLSYCLQHVTTLAPRRSYIAGAGDLRSAEASKGPQASGKTEEYTHGARDVQNRSLQANRVHRPPNLAFLPPEIPLVRPAFILLPADERQEAQTMDRKSNPTLIAAAPYTRPSSGRGIKYSTFPRRAHRLLLPPTSLPGQGQAATSANGRNAG